MGTMIANLMNLLFGCHHKRLTRPITPVRRPGNPTGSAYVACLDCGKRYELKWVKDSFDQSGRAPECVECDGYIKTATIAFGQSMPPAAMQHAEELATSADLLLAIGSSLVVWPAAGFPLMAKRNGATLVIINREPTDFDDIADLVIHHDIGDVLSRFIAN